MFLRKTDRARAMGSVDAIRYGFGMLNIPYLPKVQLIVQPQSHKKWKNVPHFSSAWLEISSGHERHLEELRVLRSQTR